MILSHYWWAWSSFLEVLKVTSLQYFYNISKKKLGMEFIFCMQINIKVSTSWHFGWKWPGICKVPKIGSWWYFCNIIGKKCCNCFCVLFWCKIFRYFTGVQSCLLLLVKNKIIVVTYKAICSAISCCLALLFPFITPWYQHWSF